MIPHRDYYQRQLPHLQPLGGTFFVTYRLHGSLPVTVRQQLQDELKEEKRQVAERGEVDVQKLDQINRRHFGRYDGWLDNPTSGPMHLANETVAQWVAESLHHYDGTRIDLIAYALMANHVHAVFTLQGEKTSDGRTNSLAALMHSLKSYSGRQANNMLGLTGPFWEKEWYDRCVRDGDELVRIVRYVLNNPVKAGLCTHWRDWPWCFTKPEYDMF